MERVQKTDTTPKRSESYGLEPHAMISTIINLVCPKCGGSMMAYRCRGKCRKEWRAEWEGALEMTRGRRRPSGFQPPTAFRSNRYRPE